MKKTVNIIINVVAWVIVLIAALMTILVFTSQSDTGVGSLFGISPISIQSDSMAPTFKKGDLILAKKYKNQELKKDDVVTFWTVIENKKVLNTHRVSQVINKDGVISYETRGDNNSKEDDKHVIPNDIVATYTGVKLAGGGKAMDFLQTSTGFFTCIVAPLVVFFLYELYRFIMVIVSLKKPKLSAEQEEELKQQAIQEYLSKQQEEKGKDGQDSAHKS